MLPLPVLLLRLNLQGELRVSHWHVCLKAQKISAVLTHACAPAPPLLLLLLLPLLQGELRMSHWRWDAQDKQTLRIIGLFSIQAVSGENHVPSHATLTCNLSLVTCHVTTTCNGHMYVVCDVWLSAWVHQIG
jgi:hypothetical protein